MTEAYARTEACAAPSIDNMRGQPVRQLSEHRT